MWREASCGRYAVDTCLVARTTTGNSPSSTPTSTSFSSDPDALFSLLFWLSFEPDAAGVVRARLGTARLGRSGVGLLSIATSFAPGLRCLAEPPSCSSSCSCRLLSVRAGCARVDASGCIVAECVNAPCVPGVGQFIKEEEDRPKPNPQGEEVRLTGPG